MKGCKRGKGETGEGKSLKKTEEEDADMKNTAYNRPGDSTPKPAVRNTHQPLLKRKTEDIRYGERPHRRGITLRTTPGRSDDKE